MRFLALMQRFQVDPVIWPILNLLRRGLLKQTAGFVLSVIDMHVVNEL
jgi:hypothetical protein